MKRLCRAGALARLLASAIGSRDQYDGPPARRQRMHFAGKNARATRGLLIALIFLALSLTPTLARARDLRCCLRSGLSLLRFFIRSMR